MAKKTVASLRNQNVKGFAKVIKAIKSPKTGSYTFKEEMVPIDMVKDFIAKK